MALQVKLKRNFSSTVCTRMHDRPSYMQYAGYVDGISFKSVASREMHSTVPVFFQKLLRMQDLLSLSRSSRHAASSCRPLSEKQATGASLVYIYVCIVHVYKYKAKRLVVVHICIYLSS
jgi:hypothetical protein